MWASVLQATQRGRRVGDKRVDADWSFLWQLICVVWRLSGVLCGVWQRYPGLTARRGGRVPLGRYVLPASIALAASLPPRPPALVRLPPNCHPSFLPPLLSRRHLCRQDSLQWFRLPPPSSHHLSRPLYHQALVHCSSPTPFRPSPLSPLPFSSPPLTLLSISLTSPITLSTSHPLFCIVTSSPFRKLISITNHTFVPSRNTLSKINRLFLSFLCAPSHTLRCMAHTWLLRFDVSQYAHTWLIRFFCDRG